MKTTNQNVSTRRVKPYAKGFTVRNYVGCVEVLHKYLRNARPSGDAFVMAVNLHGTWKGERSTRSLMNEGV